MEEVEVAPLDNSLSSGEERGTSEWTDMFTLANKSTCNMVLKVVARKFPKALAKCFSDTIECGC